MWGRRKSSERPPWYRASGYRGKLTEAEKRELDAFRAQPSHPAFEYGELPEHVEMYISGLEIEAYDLKQARAFGRALTCSLIGAAVLYATHFGFSRRELDLGLRIRDSAPDRPVDRLPLRDSKRLFSATPAKASKRNGSWITSQRRILRRRGAILQACERGQSSPLWFLLRCRCAPAGNLVDGGAAATRRLLNVAPRRAAAQHCADARVAIRVLRPDLCSDPRRGLSLCLEQRVGGGRRSPCAPQRPACPTSWHLGRQTCAG